MDLRIEPELIPVVAVALITWGGVLAFMFRLNVATNTLERRLDEIEENRAADHNEVTG